MQIRSNTDFTVFQNTNNISLFQNSLKNLPQKKKHSPKINTFLHFYYTKLCHQKLSFQ